MTILRLILFLISNIGFYKLLSKKTKIDMHFIPMLIIGLQIFILFISGILNILFITSILLYIGGISIFVYYLFKDKDFINEFKNTNYLVFILSIVILTICLLGCKFINYDNFSHWALVVKSMLINNRYPNFMDSVILFKEYPLGVATYIYYFSKMVGNAEWIWMLGQNIIIMAFSLPILKYVKKNKILAYIFYLFFINFILSYNSLINDLAVDTVLPLVGLGITLFIYEEGMKDKNIIYLIPLLSLLFLIKNSGIFFIIIDIVLLIYLMKKNGKLKDIKLWGIMSTPILTWLVWHQHSKYVFDGASSSKHAMTLSNYMNVFKNKSINDMITIASKAIKWIITCRETYIFLGFIIILGLLIYIASKKSMKRYMKITTLLLGIYLFYVVGIILMYIFSMPLNEAMVLASISRYYRTILIFIYGILAIYSIKLISQYEIKNIVMISIILISLINVINIVSLDKYGNVFNVSKNAIEREKIEEIININKLEKDKKYIICISSSDSGYNYYLYKYLLFNDIGVIVVRDYDDTKYFDNYDYIINTDQNNIIINEWLELNYSNQINNEIIKLGE